jgi:urease accessory protein
MTDATALLRLMSWLSPVFPIGGFAYSAGLEQAVHAGQVSDLNSLSDWINVQITQGAQWNDAVILVEAHRCSGDKAKLAELSGLCLALCIGQERLNETVGQGTSFLLAVSHWVDPGHFPDRDPPLPVAVGIAAGVERIDPDLTVSAYLHAFVSNQLQCAIRLSVVGQEGAAKALASMETLIERTARRAAGSTLEDLGGAAFIADIASMNHEILEPRLFLS